MVNGTGPYSSQIERAIAALLNGGITVPVTSVTGLGTGVATALAVNVGSAGAFVTFNGALGTPSSGTLTNATGLPWAGVSKSGSSLADLATRAVANLSDGSNVALLNAANTFTTTQTVAGDSATLKVRSADYEIIMLQNGGSGAALDEGLVGVKKDGVIKAYMYAGSNATYYGLTWPTTASAANAYVADDAEIKRSTSSARYKTDIESISLGDAHRTVAGLRCVTYRGLSPDDRPLPFAGLIAEEVATINPLLVTFEKDGVTPNYVTYDRVVAYVVPVVQDHERRLAAVEAALKIPPPARGPLAALDAKRTQALAAYRTWETTHTSHGRQILNRAARPTP